MGRIRRRRCFGVCGIGRDGLGQAQALSRELYAEAIAKFGEKEVHAKNSASLARMQRFLTTHPKYGQLMKALRELPQHLLPKGRLVPVVNSGVTNAAARHFRKTFSLPYDKWNSSRYFSTIGRQLNGKISYFKGLGKHATWYIPAAIGIYNVAKAPEELRMKTLFGEGFGMLGGAIGPVVGTNLTILGTSCLAAAFGICISPFGIFILAFLLASAGGIYFSGKFKEMGMGVYDLGTNFLNGETYFSPDQILCNL